MGQPGTPSLKLSRGEDLALGLVALGPEDAHALELALGAVDGDGLLAGELTRLDEVLGLRELVARPEEGLEVLLGDMDMSIGQVDEDAGLGHGEPPKESENRWTSIERGSDKNSRLRRGGSSVLEPVADPEIGESRHRELEAAILPSSRTILATGTFSSFTNPRPRRHTSMRCFLILPATAPSKNGGALASHPLVVLDLLPECLGSLLDMRVGDGGFP